MSLDRRPYASAQELAEAIWRSEERAPSEIVVAGVRITARDSAPTSGRWSAGDVAFNSAPSSGGYVGWVCVESGRPGQWKAFGAIT